MSTTLRSMLTKTEFNKRNFSQNIVKEVKPQAKESFETSEILSPKTINQILVISLFVSLFLLGKMSTEINFLKNQKVTTAQAPNINVPANNPTSVPVAQPTVDPKTLKLVASDHILGDPDSRLQLIVFSDLECPFSKRFQTTVNKIADEYKKQVTIVYRHFPLDQIHSQTRKEAQATECAAKLAGNDGFWKLTEKIYETTPSNDGLDLSSLPNLATQVGIDKADFQSCLDSGEMAQTVENQYQSGLKAGVNGTPGSFLVDTKTGEIKSIQGAQPYEQVKPLIDQLLTN